MPDLPVARERDAQRTGGVAVRLDEIGIGGFGHDDQVICLDAAHRRYCVLTLCAIAEFRDGPLQGREVILKHLFAL